MGLLHRLKPARQNNEDVEIFADLDAIVTKPRGFKLHGKIHVIDKMTTEDFINLGLAWTAFLKEQYKEKATKEDLINLFFNAVSCVCSTLTKEDIAKMNSWQFPGLYQTIIDIVVTGKPPQVETINSFEKKNPLKS